MVAYLHDSQSTAYRTITSRSVHKSDHDLDTGVECVRTESVDFTPLTERGVFGLCDAVCDGVYEAQVSDDGGDGFVRLLLHRQ